MSWGCRLEKSMLDLRWRSEKEQMAELEKWTVRDMRTVLARQGIRIGVNTRANLISKVLVRRSPQPCMSRQLAEAVKCHRKDNADTRPVGNVCLVVLCF